MALKIALGLIIGAGIGLGLNRLVAAGGHASGGT
jgi:hypothetical protein